MLKDDPVSAAAPGPDGDAPSGIGLCLSGGGYRAMLFHTGSLLRLHEVGLLPRLSRISSVSGGSITSAVLALAWPQLMANPGDPAIFDRHVTKPIRRLAGKTIDVGAVVKGLLLPGPVSSRIARAYDKHLFMGKTLADLPTTPRFVFCATSVQSAALVRFAHDGIRDYRLGHVRMPTLPLSIAVAASSAFPPVLSPTTIDVSGQELVPLEGSDLPARPYGQKLILTDGGVYDNLGLETLWKRCERILVSDAGGKIAADAEPKHDWLQHVRRVLDVIDNQVRSLRVRQLIDAFESGRRDGAYWGIRSDIANFGVPSLPCPHADSMKIAGIATRLAAMGDTDQERLINWGYAVCDAAIRRHVDPSLPAAVAFPYPNVGVD